MLQNCQLLLNKYKFFTVYTDMSFNVRVKTRVITEVRGTIKN